METKLSPTARMLLKSWMQLKKMDLHPQSIAGYKPSEGRLLFCIKYGKKPDSPGPTVTDLSKLLHVTSPTVTQLINELAGKGLLQRNVDPKDRRVVRITLTETGEQIIQKLGDSLAASLKGLIEYLGEEESRQLAELLSKVAVYLQERNTNPNQSLLRGEDEGCSDCSDF